MGSSSDDECDAFVAARYAAWSRSALLLTGDPHAAQDLAQETAVRVIRRWRDVAAADDQGAYAGRLLLNVFLAGRRRRWHGEVPHSEVPDRAGPPAGTDAVDARDELRRALAALPPRQRAAVVLRHYEQRTEAETAAALGCSVGTVKSLAWRGLQRLRLDAAVTTSAGEGT